MIDGKPGQKKIKTLVKSVDKVWHLYILQTDNFHYTHTHTACRCCLKCPGKCLDPYVVIKWETARAAFLQTRFTGDCDLTYEINKRPPAMSLSSVLLLDTLPLKVTPSFLCWPSFSSVPRTSFLIDYDARTDLHQAMGTQTNQEI